MSNEELVCTPDLVVSNLRLNDLNKHASGKDIKMSERLCLVPPILTDNQEPCSVVTENFRKICQMVVDRLAETQQTILKMMDQVDSVSVESYQKQFDHVQCEINQIICTLNVAKHKMMIDRVNLMGQVKAPIIATALANNSHQLTTKTSPPSRIVLKMSKVPNVASQSQQDTIQETITTNTNGSTTDTMNTSSNSALLLPSFNSIPTFSDFLEQTNNNHLMDCFSSNLAIDDEIAEKKEQQRKKRRARNLKKRLMKQIRPCKVKLIRHNLNKMKEELMQQNGTFSANNGIRNGFLVGDENDVTISTTTTSTTTVDTSNTADAESASTKATATVFDIHPKNTENSLNSLNGCIVTNHNNSYSSILITNSLNVNKSQKSVSFAPDVIDKSSS